MHEVVFHRLDHETAVSEVGRYARDELGTRPEVREVRLIGSLARDDWSARSDADVLVLVDGRPAPGASRSVPYTPTSPLRVPVDVFVYTAEEAERWGERFRTEVENGLLLYRR